MLHLTCGALSANPSRPPWMDLVTPEGDAFQAVWRAAGIVGLAECEIVRRLTLEHQVCTKP